MAAAKYRVGVIGVFTNKAGEVLICERSNQKDAWQFPQGGMEEGETPIEAILRESQEELGTDQVEIVSTSPDMTQYDFPKELVGSIAKNFVGQRHYWFLMKFKENAGPDLAKSDGEFQEFRWVPLNQCLHAVVHWKKLAYEEGLRLLELAK